MYFKSIFLESCFSRFRRGCFSKCMERLQLFSFCVWSDRIWEIILYGWIWSQ